MRIGEASTGIGDQMADTGAAIQRARDKTEEMQARASAMDELIAGGTLEDFTSGGETQLDRELAQLTSKSKVDDELEKMKAEIGSGSESRRSSSSSEHVAHWDDVEAARREKGEMAASWQRLGDAVGCVGIGVNRVRIDPGRLSTPPHSHGASEEIVFVLGGSGFSWQDEQVYELRPGDCIVHLADHEEHTLRGGPDGLDVLIYGTRHPTELGWLPRSKAIRLGWPWVEGRTDDPWDVEAQAEPLVFGEPAPRPKNIVNVDEAEAEEWEDARLRLRRARARPPGGLCADRHAPRVHPRGEAQLPAALPRLGGGVLRRARRRGHVPARRRGASRCGAGSIVGRPPGTGVAHAFRGGPLTLLTYGTNKPNEICYYPRSNKIGFFGVGVIGRIEKLDYWDGEPPPPATSRACPSDRASLSGLDLARSGASKRASQRERSGSTGSSFSSFAFSSSSSALSRSLSSPVGMNGQNAPRLKP